MFKINVSQQQASLDIFLIRAALAARQCWFNITDFPKIIHRDASSLNWMKGFAFFL
jgi:hypothetical protein